MLGGNNIAVAGPCFNRSVDKLVCKFGGIQTQGVVVNGLRGVCTVPTMYLIGPIQLNVSIDGGKNFKFTGKYTLRKFQIQWGFLNELAGWKFEFLIHLIHTQFSHSKR